MPHNAFWTARQVFFLWGVDIGQKTCIMRLEISNYSLRTGEKQRGGFPMNNKAAWNMLKRRLLNVWLPAALIVLVLVCSAQ